MSSSVHVESVKVNVIFHSNYDKRRVPRVQLQYFKNIPLLAFLYGIYCRNWFLNTTLKLESQWCEVSLN